MTPLLLKCDCCGHEGLFQDAEEAFNAGWDAPPHFTGYVGCNLCPGAFIVLGQTDCHAGVHERWQREGRPLDFSLETCLDEASIRELTDLVQEACLDELTDVVKREDDS